MTYETVTATVALSAATVRELAQPITGKGPLARRYAQPNHGLTLTNCGGTLDLARRTRAAIDKVWFEFEELDRSEVEGL